jgi:hypothetical protein
MDRYLSGTMVTHGASAMSARFAYTSVTLHLTAQESLSLLATLPDLYWTIFHASRSASRTINGDEYFKFPDWFNLTDEEVDQVAQASTKHKLRILLNELERGT